MSQTMTRSEFMKVMAAGAAAANVPAFALWGNKATERPNVLFICIDDLNDWVGCMGGHPDARTPNLDRLARRGVLFTNAHCAATSCNPSSRLASDRHVALSTSDCDMSACGLSVRSASVPWLSAARPRVFHGSIVLSVERGRSCRAAWQPSVATPGSDGAVPRPRPSRRTCGASLRPTRAA